MAYSARFRVHRRGTVMVHHCRQSRSVSMFIFLPDSRKIIACGKSRRSLVSVRFGTKMYTIVHERYKIVHDCTRLCFYATQNGTRLYMNGTALYMNVHDCVLVRHRTVQKCTELCSYSFAVRHIFVQNGTRLCHINPLMRHKTVQGYTRSVHPPVLL